MHRDSVGAERIHDDDVVGRWCGVGERDSPVADHDVDHAARVRQEREQRAIAGDALNDGIDLVEREPRVIAAVTRERTGAQPDQRNGIRTLVERREELPDRA